MMARRIVHGKFAAVIRSYLASEKFASLAPSSKATWRPYLMLAEDILGEIDVAEIRPNLAQGFLDGLSHKPGAQASAHAALVAVQKYALVRDLVPFPFMTGCTLIGGGGGHRPWTDEQVAIAEAHARPEIARVITLAANTGQRGSDLVKMRWSDIEAVDGHPGINVTQQKTGLQLWIPFTQQLRTAMERWERQPTFLLLRSTGQPWTRPHLSKHWETERDRNPELAPCAGMVLHGLRATAIVRLRRLGAKPTQISDMIGLSVPMVERYCRFADQKTSALAAVHYLDRHRAEHQANKTAKGE